MIRYTWTDVKDITMAIDHLIPAHFFSDQTRDGWRRFRWLYTGDIVQREWASVAAVAKALLQRDTLSDG